MTRYFPARGCFGGEVIEEGWLLPASVIEPFNRQLPGWSMREQMTRDSVIDALRMAWLKRHPNKQAGLIFSSDRGSQYASEDFRDRRKEYGVTAPLSLWSALGVQSLQRDASRIAEGGAVARPVLDRSRLGRG
ncbi:MAG: DDE-type integrase/transposase/recombinase [Rhodanobacter sp.]|jgi:transposase InsO family protein|nr:DDE-type integrase/transposase/recombinase [Rhodanobacter sp.]